MARKWIYIDDVKLVEDKIVTIDVGSNEHRIVIAGRIILYDECSLKLDISKRFYAQEKTVAYSYINHIWEGEVEDAKQTTTSDNRQ